LDLNKQTVCLKR